ncbi:MAG: hypothetical protein ACKVQA_02760 [Burkholderiales bacterium]
MTPEQLARQEIDRLLTAAGWSVQDFKAANVLATREGVRGSWGRRQNNGLRYSDEQA